MRQLAIISNNDSGLEVELFDNLEEMISTLVWYLELESLERVKEKVDGYIQTKSVNKEVKS